MKRESKWAIWIVCAGIFVPLFVIVGLPVIFSIIKPRIWGEWFPDFNNFFNGFFLVVGILGWPYLVFAFIGYLILSSEKCSKPARLSVAGGVIAGSVTIISIWCWWFIDTYLIPDQPAPDAGQGIGLFSFFALPFIDIFVFFLGLGVGWIAGRYTEKIMSN